MRDMKPKSALMAMLLSFLIGSTIFEHDSPTDKFLKMICVPVGKKGEIGQFKPQAIEDLKKGRVVSVPRKLMFDFYKLEEPKEPGGFRPLLVKSYGQYVNYQDKIMSEIEKDFPGLSEKILMAKTRQEYLLAFSEAIKALVEKGCL